MEKGTYYSIITKKFVLHSKYTDWLNMNQDLYNDVLLFYYQLYLDHSEIWGMNNQQDFRALEVMTVVGRDKSPVPNPLPWIKVPMYFRRAAINGALAASKSYLARDEQQEKADNFHESVTFYKGMYRNFSETSIELKIWNGEAWKWISCELHGNTLPVNAKQLSPSVVIRGKRIFLHVPIKEEVSDGRKAIERMAEGTDICCVHFTNGDVAAVCAILDSKGIQKSVHFIKGGKQYEHRCHILMEKISKSQKALGGAIGSQPNKKYWKKLQNNSVYFSNCISRQVINFSIESGASIIVLPKFEEKYKKSVMKKVGNWSSLHAGYKIRDQLFYKGWQKGILVLEVDIRNVGSKCSKCGADIKKMKESFLCPNGHMGNRYLNTAVNMGRKCLASFQKHVL